MRPAVPSPSTSPSLTALARQSLRSRRDGLRLGLAVALGLVPVVGTVWQHAWLARAVAHIARGRPGLPAFSVRADLRVAARGGVAVGVTALAVFLPLAGPIVSLLAVLSAAEVAGIQLVHSVVESLPTTVSAAAAVVLGAAVGLLALLGEVALLLPLLVVAVECLRWVSRDELLPPRRWRASVAAIQARPQAFVQHMRWVVALCVGLQVPALVGLTELPAVLAWGLLGSVVGLVGVLGSTARWDATVRAWEAEGQELQDAPLPATVSVV